MFKNFADWFVYQILGISSDTSFGEALHFFVYDSLKILFLLFTIITIISFLRSYIDSEKIKKQIEKQPRFIAHTLAALLGAVTPFCSCSSIPLFIGFIEAGIPFGVAMTFLITSPMINEIAILVLAGVVGIKVTVLYVATGFVVGLAGGYLLEKFGLQKYLQDYLLKPKSTKQEVSCCSCTCGTKNPITAANKLKDSLFYAKDLFKKIWLFVLIGVGFGAGLHGYVPTAFIAKYLGAGNFFAVPVSVLLGIPLYSDATTIIPIAQVLIEKGASIGTILVFMMSTVALSLPELIILTRVMKKTLIVRFVVFMFVIFVLVGYFYNLVL
ncbi:MAG: permease [Candidatus Gastranaerophilales bacterium]|nr:permease [Candidatus Gastranaerophilales bacterium]MCM1072691.1 permease [Bacteroides sp.]